MRCILLSLILVLATSGFVIAESTSDIRTDFYISTLSTDSIEQQSSFNTTNWIIYGNTTLIIIIVTIIISQKDLTFFHY